MYPARSSEPSTSGATSARLTGTRDIAWCFLGLALPAVAFFPIIDNFFNTDDFLHLYHIVNRGTLEFLLRMHGGHLLLTRNALFALSFAAFGTHAAAYFRMVLLTHLLNVFLLFRVIRNFTDSPRLACFGAALWGVLPVHEGALGWYSVYGHVLVATCTLIVLSAFANVAVGRSYRATAPVLWALLLLAGATSFGVGIAIGIAMPLVALLLLPASPLRRRTLVLFSILAASLPCLYFALEQLHLEWFGGVRRSGVLIASLENWHQHLEVFAQLVGYGISCVVLGVLQRPRFYPGDAAYAVVAAYAVLVLAVLAASPGVVRRRIGACLTICAAAYAIIALGRGMFSSAGGAALWAQMARFHYVPTAALVIAMCLALARLAQWVRLPGPAGTSLVLAWAVLTLAAQQLLGTPIDHFAAARKETNWVLNSVRRAALSAPPDSTVYVENKTFRSVGLALAGSRAAFPGWAALYTIYFPTDVIDGRTIRFVERDPEAIAAVRGDRRTATLLVAPAEAGSAPPGAAAIAEP